MKTIRTVLASFLAASGAMPAAEIGRNMMGAFMPSTVAGSSPRYSTPNGGTPTGAAAFKRAARKRRNVLARRAKA